MIFIPENIENAELNQKMNYLGIAIGFFPQKSDWSGSASIVGKTYAIKESLKASGARWDGLNKAWKFASVEAASAAVMSLEVA